MPSNSHQPYPLRSPSLFSEAANGDLLAAGWLNLRGDDAHFRGFVRPEARGHGLGSALIAWAETQAQAANANALIVHSEGNTPDADTLYTTAGFERILAEEIMRRDLTTPLPTAALPTSMSAQPWNAATRQAFYAAFVDGFQDRFVSEPDPAEEWLAEYEESDEFRPELSLVLIDEERPIGFIAVEVRETSSMRGEHPGWISQTAVAPSHRRRGLASGMIVHTFNQMRASGLDIALLHVNINNPGAIAAYQALGFEIAGRRARYRKNLRA